MKKHSKTNKTESSRKQLVKQQNCSSEPNYASKEIQAFAKRLGHQPRIIAQTEVAYYVGIDLGDKRSNYRFLDARGNLVDEGSLTTTHVELDALFSSIPKCRIAIEVGTHSPWANALLKSHGHEVFVANPRKMESIQKNRRKNDRVDARILARFVRADPELLYPIQHRGIDARQSLVLLRARYALVGVRTKLINCVRGLAKSMGGRLPKCSADSFHKAVAEKLPDEIRAALLPLVAQIEEITARIREYDLQVQGMAAKKYPETGALRQVRGVGPVTSLAYILTLENPERFSQSRDVGSYLGLIPRQDDSGESSKQLRITKTGDRMLRQLLVSSAQYILGPFGEDCDLQRFGLKLAARGGKNAKKRAVVAVARKLSVMLHRLWLTGEVYEPLRNTHLREGTLASAAKA